MAADAIFKKYGIPGLLLLGAAICLWWFIQHKVERSYEPGSLVVEVLGGTEPMSLLLDNRNTDAPPHTSFFRLEAVRPGLHRVELRTSTAALYSEKIDVLGGAETRHLVDLSAVSVLPSFSLPAESGWLFIGTKTGETLEDSVLAISTLPGIGESVAAEHPAFVRASLSTSGGGEAFAAISRGDELLVKELRSYGTEVWAKVEPVPPENPPEQ